MAGGSSGWRAEDLLDLERCGLAAELASTNITSGVSGSGWVQGNSMAEDVDINTYDFSEVLDNLLDNKELPLLQSSMTTHPLPPEVGQQVREQLEVVLKSPLAYGIKTDMEKVTYLNRGQSYEIQLQHFSSTPVMFTSALSLTFCELRWLNSEREHFDQWCREHPQNRLLQIDSIGCAGLASVENDDANLNRVHFVWGQSNTVLAIKINCLSSEFAAKKHGGEKGVALRLCLEMYECEADKRVVYRGGCGIKVFKDKGGDRKQRQDQCKMEKLSPHELVKYHNSEPNTRFVVDLSTSSFQSSSGVLNSFTSQSDSSTLSQTPGASPYALASPPLPCVQPAVSTSHSSVTSCVSVEDTQRWLALNRFGQYSSVFANYTGSDFVCMSRGDLMDLCGHADGIRFYNSLQSRTIRTLYVRFKQEDKVYQAVCLEELTAKELLTKLLDKLTCLDMAQVTSFVRLTAAGLLVRVDNAVVQAMPQEASFLLQAIKEESGSYQVLLQDCVAPTLPRQISLSLQGSAPRH